MNEKAEAQDSTGDRDVVTEFRKLASNGVSKGHLEEWWNSLTVEEQLTVTDYWHECMDIMVAGINRLMPVISDMAHAFERFTAQVQDAWRKVESDEVMQRIREILEQK